MASRTQRSELIDGESTQPRRIYSHPLILVGCLLFAVVLIQAINLLLPAEIAVVLTDRDRSTYPFTVQNLMWLVFAFGLGELIVRGWEAANERSELKRGYLPEDERTLLQGPDLQQHYATVRVANQPGSLSAGRFLPRLILRVLAQFQSTRSIEQANTLLNSSLDLFLHEIDLRYSMIRYVVWVIPTLGFIGTVVGISLALAFAGQVDLQDPNLLSELTKRLAVAFNTTLLALVMSAILVFIQHTVQASEERALNQAGQYCLDNLINRLYED
ncbi:MAG: MotA/TolQ/ExbB proton channel family protein [Geminicoccaceae bacterium]